MGQVEAPVWGGAREDLGRTGLRCPAALRSHPSLVSVRGGREGTLGVSTLQGIPIPTPSLLLGSLLLLGSRGPVTPAHLGSAGREGE